MAKYGEVATRAVGLMLWRPPTNPLEAWEEAAALVFPDSPASRGKGCPKSAFLGLCEEGVVAGVPPGSYTRSALNKEYALVGLTELRRSPELVSHQRQLWRAATRGKEIQPNSQMEVLTALWEAGLIR